MVKAQVSGSYIEPPTRAFVVSLGRKGIRKASRRYEGIRTAVVLLPVLIVVLWGGFLTNFIWSAILILKNHSAKQFAGEPGLNPMRATHASGDTLVDFDPLDPSTYDRLAPKTLVANYIFAAMAGVIWYFQFFFYSMGQTKMGKYDFSSWTLHMASIIIFATLLFCTRRDIGSDARGKREDLILSSRPTIRATCYYLCCR